LHFRIPSDESSVKLTDDMVLKVTGLKAKTIANISWNMIAQISDKD
jgi:hypothetical protein